MTRRLFASHPRASCMASARTFLDTSTLSSTLNQSVLLLKAFFPTHCTRWHTRNSNALVRWVAPFHPDHPTRVFLFLWVSISDRRSTFYHILACLLVVSRWQSRHFAGQGGVQRTINPQPARFLSARHGTVMWRPVRSTDSQHPQLLMEISSKW